MNEKTETLATIHETAGDGLIACITDAAESPSLCVGGSITTKDGTVIDFHLELLGVTDGKTGKRVQFRDNPHEDLTGPLDPKELN